MIENPLITGTITARRLSEAVAEAEGYDWKARCTGYRLEGTGDDADEAIDDLISQIRRAHQKSRMVLKNPDKLEIDYDIIRVTASIRIGDNPNKSLADFMPEESGRTILGVPVEDWKKEGVSKIEFSSPGHEPESIVIDGAEATAVPDEPSISDDGVEDGLPHVPDVQLVAGCNICSKYASGDCGGNNTNEPCKRYKVFEYAGEKCETCRYFHNGKYCAKYHAVTEPDHYACVGYLEFPGPQTPEADVE